MGIGPFLASFSLLRGYLKFVPIVYQILLILAIITDKILNILVKTNLKTIYPIGYMYISMLASTLNARLTMAIVGLAVLTVIEQFKVINN